MPLDFSNQAEPVALSGQAEPLDFSGQAVVVATESDRAARRADLRSQQAVAREQGVSTSLSARLGAGIEQGLRTPELMIRGGLDALQYYRALDAVTGSGNRFQSQNEAELRAMRDRDAFLDRETQAIEGRDGRNFVGDLVQGVTRGIVELPPQLMAGAAGAMRGTAVQASAAFGGAQGGLTQYAQDRGEGRGQLESLPPAIASGIITAVTTRAFGDSGVEAVFRNEGVQGFRRRLVGALREVGMGGAEEIVDEVQQDLLERATRHPGKPLADSLYDVLQAGAVGAFISGAANAPRLIARSNRPATTTLPDGREVIVNEQTGGTEFGLEVDELPAPAATAETATPETSQSAIGNRQSASELPEVPGVPTPLEGQPYEVESFKERTERLMRAKADKVAKVMSESGETGAVELVSTKRPNTRLLVTPDPAELGKWRVTRVDESGPAGHDLFSSRDAAVRAAAGESFTSAVRGPSYYEAGEFRVSRVRQLPKSAGIAEVPGVPTPLEGQPYEPGLQRDPAVSPELADAIAAEVRPAKPGEQPQPPAQAAPTMQEGMDNLRFTSAPVAKAKRGGADAKDAKAKLIAELEKAVEQAPAQTEAQAQAVKEMHRAVGLITKFRSARIAEAAVGMKKSGLRKVTIEIPGDGTFTVWNTKENLTELLKKAKRLATSTKSPKGFSESDVSKEDREWVEQMQAAQGKPMQLWEVRYQDRNNNNLTATVEARTEFEAEDKVGNEVKEAFKILPGTKYVGEATAASVNTVRVVPEVGEQSNLEPDIIERIERLKLKPGGLYSLPDLGLTVTLWNGTLTAAQLALRAGRSLAQSLQAGLDWLRAQGQAFDEAKVRGALEQALLKVPGIREHVGKRLLQENFSPAAKAALDPLLRHEVKPDAQLFAEAAAVVEAIGPMEAEANYWGNPWGLPADAHVVLGFAIGNGLSTLEAQARAAGDAALADRIGRQNAEFQSQFVLQSTETARTLRAYRYFDLVGNLSPFTADLFARKVIEKASQKEKQRIKPVLDKGPDGEPGLTDRLNDINRAGINETAAAPEVQTAARTAINQAIEAEAQKPDTAVQKAITLEVSNTLETLPSVVRKANAAVVRAWDKLASGEQVRQQTGRAGQALENSLWSAVKQRGGAVSTVSSVIAQVNRALHEQVNRALGVTPEQFVNPTTYFMRLRDALGNAEVMSRIWEQTRAAVGANLRAIGEMEGLLLRIEAEIADLEAQAKAPLDGGPEVTASEPKLKAQQQAARDEMLKGRNAAIAEAIKQRRERIADVTAHLAEYRKMQPAWEAVLNMTVDVWGPNLLRGVLREQMKADGFRLRKAVADHFRGLAGAVDPLQTLGTLRDKIIAASGLDPQAAERLAKDLEAEYTAQVNKERARLAERLRKTRERQAARAAQKAIDQPRLDAEALIDSYERRQTEWLAPAGRKSAVRAIVRQALREGAAVAGLNEQVVRGGLQAQLEAVGVPREAAYRLAYEVWQDRQAKGGGVDAVVAARVRELQLDLGRVIRQHWTQVSRAGESLAEHIVGETKLPAEQAERLAAAIQRRFKALVQARKEKAIRNLTKTPAARTLQKPTIAQRIIEATNLGALDSEGLWSAVAEKLGLPTYTTEASAEVKRLADRAQQLPEASVQRQEATARMMRFIARQKGINLGDLGWAFWYANTLSGPITHAVNTFSNALSLAANVTTQLRDVRGAPQILAATADGFRTGLTEARAILKQGPSSNRTKFTEQGQALENLDPHDFTGAGLVRKWRYVARALAAADAAFYFPAREAKAITLARALARQEGRTGKAIRQRAQEILDGTEQQQTLWGAQVDRERAQLEALGEKPDPLWTTRRLEQLREQGWGAEIGEAADDFALRTTYNNKPYGLIGQMAEWVKTGHRRVPGLRAVVPFVDVVANVVNDSINYTPWGFARAYAAGRTGQPSVTLSLPFEWAESLREGKQPMTPDAVVDLHAKAALGTAMVGSLMAMALDGLDDDDGQNFQLYGSGPKDAAAKAALRETGWIPYSVRVNGKYLSFANTPLAIPLGAMGHYLDAARYDKRFERADAFNRLGVALWGGAHIITQQSFLDGLARLLGALEERRGRTDTAADRAVEQAFRTASSVAVPNALRQLDRLFDPTIYDQRGIEGALVASIPFARRTGSPALNALGEPITSEPWKRFASDAEANVWTDLARRKIYPSVADKAKNAQGREMTDDEHYRYVQESGQAIKRRLEQLNIRALSDADLEKKKDKIVSEERERTRRRLGF